ncbi:hypothetical protein XENOCAPTIV_020840 [Xenoophorus captivus]|uniref:Uncharacterized protein n=1 Tax=Xenoophorus captivus TaxID=1517983 RepID=A0ABV0RLS4_9TELE
MWWDSLVLLNWVRSYLAEQYYLRFLKAPFSGHCYSISACAPLTPIMLFPYPFNTIKNSHTADIASLLQLNTSTDVLHHYHMTKQKPHSQHHPSCNTYTNSNRIKINIGC